MIIFPGLSAGSVFTSPSHLAMSGHGKSNAAADVVEDVLDQKGQAIILDELGATITKFADTMAPLGLTTLASSAPFVGSFVIGLVLGLKKG